MRHIISILLGLLTISALCCAAEPGGLRQETAVTGDIAAEVGAPTALHLRIVRDGFQLTWAISPQDPGTATEAIKKVVSQMQTLCPDSSYLFPMENGSSFDGNSFRKIVWNKALVSHRLLTRRRTVLGIPSAPGRLPSA